MRLLPLVLSAHPSSWHRLEPVGGRQERHDPPTSSCRFCGCAAPGWLAWFHLNGDHDDDRPENRAGACPLCHLLQHLDRPQIEQEAGLIWLPEMSQAAVIALARRIHQVFLAHGEPPTLGRRPRTEAPAFIAAYCAYQALAARETALVDRIGTSAPAILGAALLELHSDIGVGPDIAGIRLLPRGRLYQNGEDVYPRLLVAGPVPSFEPGRRQC